MLCRLNLAEWSQNMKEDNVVVFRLLWTLAATSVTPATLATLATLAMVARLTYFSSERDVLSILQIFS